MIEKVIYFSLNNTAKKNFYEYIRDKKICYSPKFSFSLEAEDTVFNDPRDLITVIEKEHKKDLLHIIIDYVSMCGNGKEKNYSTVMRDIIMCYPEVQFLFDETYVKMENAKRKKAIEEAKRKEDIDEAKHEEDIVDAPEFSFMNFLFWKNPKEELDDECMKQVLAEFHQFDLSENNISGEFDKKVVERQFILLLKGRNNMYDGSNLRYAIKKCKFTKLDVEENYKKIEESRRDHAAVVVEEEYHQNMFNGYCLYVNGFRVFPIITANELRWINKQYEKTAEKPLLIRDYDLQFIDEDKVQRTPMTDKKLNEIDFIRKAKAITVKNQDESVSILEYEVLPKDGNPYWSNFNESQTYFVSKGEDALKVKLDHKEAMQASHDADGQPCLNLRGIKKPLEGIYASMKTIGIVGDRFEAIRVKTGNDGKPAEKFITSRKDGNHSYPLDIYGIARSMVKRAELYYKFNRPRLAALVAGEALEVLNGFHKSLMNQAYYILSVSENAMAMSLLGGNEEMLKKDINIRMGEKVKPDVERMIKDYKDRYNLLYNIFNDCMLFCQEKEYFVAADEALSFMVYEKEGVEFKGWIKAKVKKAKKIAKFVFCKSNQ